MNDKINWGALNYREFKKIEQAFPFEWRLYTLFSFVGYLDDKPILYEETDCGETLFLGINLDNLSYLIFYNNGDVA